MKPATLTHEGIAARVPHAGTMCLLDRLESWSAERIHCSAVSHRDGANPLRTKSGLLAPCAIEYAAQAMALHGALVGDDRAPPTPGYLASVRGVRCHVARLDAIDAPLQISAERLAGDARQILYAFSVSSPSGEVCVEGRATVVLNTPIVPAGAA